MKIEEMRNGLRTGDYGDCLTDYRDSSSYICDAIMEIADNHTSIYYHDILEFIKKNPESLADVVAEGLYEVRAGREYDLFKHGQAAEYMVIERDIYDHLRDSIMVATLDFIQYDLEMVEIPDELAELVEEWVDDADNNDRMWDIPNSIREWLETDEEDEETEC